MSNNMNDNVANVSKPNNRPVFSPKLANKLLRNGFEMASVSRNKRDNVSTVFYFKPADGLDDMITEFVKETKEAEAVEATDETNA